MAFLASPIFAAATSLIGTGVGVASAIGTANYQSAVAEQNAKIAQQNAARATDRAAIEAQENDLLTRGMLGQQMAAMSASGVSTDSPSFLMTRKAARTRGRLDTLNIIQGGQVESYNHQLDAVNQRAAAAGARSQGYANAIGTGLGGLGNLIGMARPSPMASRFDPWVTKSTNLRRYG
jgi:hypothetical protein